jgi:hypothetical protein
VRRSFKTCLLTVLIGSALAASACSSSDGNPRIPRASSGATAEPQIMATPTTVAQSVAAAPADLHDVDWARVPLPGEFCGVPGLVTFKGDEATATSDKWGPVHLFRFHNSQNGSVVYGDVTGDHRSEAAVNVGCDNGGGTAGGQLAFAFVVFQGIQGRLTVIGTVVPQKNPPNQHATLLWKVQLTRGRVIAHENWYRPSDSTCCPTGTAVTIWTLQDGHLTPGAPRIIS